VMERRDCLHCCGIAMCFSLPSTGRYLRLRAPVPVRRAVSFSLLESSLPTLVHVRVTCICVLGGWRKRQRTW
jgi:hypothetical protein